MNARSEAGAVAVLVAVFATVAFAFLAIIVDLGMARDLKLRTVGAADSASLAGAAELDNCTTRRCVGAVAAVKSLVAKNLVTKNNPTINWGACRATPPAGWVWRRMRSRTTCIQFGWSGTVTGKPDVVYVAIPRQSSPVSFGGIVPGYEGVHVSAQSVAGQSETQSAACALCVIDDFSVDVGNLSVGGGGSFYATTADLDLGSAGMVTSVAGSFLSDRPPANNVIFAPNPPVVTGRPVTNPFATPVIDPPNAPNLPGPTADAVCDPTTPLAPGTYVDLDVTSNCQLEGGIYEFQGSVHVHSGALLTDASAAVGGGATVSLVGGASSLTLDPGARLQLSGDPSTRFALYSTTGLAISGDSDVAGVFLSDGDLQLSDNAAINAEVYVPHGRLVAGPGVVTVSGTAVVRDLHLQGNGSLVVNSVGTPGVPQPGVPDMSLVR